MKRLVFQQESGFNSLEIESLPRATAHRINARREPWRGVDTTKEEGTWERQAAQATTLR